MVSLFNQSSVAWFRFFRFGHDGMGTTSCQLEWDWVSEPMGRGEWTDYTRTKWDNARAISKLEG